MKKVYVDSSKSKVTSPLMENLHSRNQRYMQCIRALADITSPRSQNCCRSICSLPYLHKMLYNIHIISLLCYAAFRISSWRYRKISCANRVGTQTGIEEINVKILVPRQDGLLNYGISTEMPTSQMLIQRSQDKETTWCEVQAVGNVFQ
ncbi:hypothetical protein AVEN_263579-1 [Araneus ventricosus]|uniref:Uncharacterized protein n=1 Tax=Araneus ventricosus TaxID=182803 RepID=A0A4Y2HTV3_ARAVE|nr:hypothetical protein AVEN_263579-1 [Araneus ventricosus]